MLEAPTYEEAAPLRHVEAAAVQLAEAQGISYMEALLQVRAYGKAPTCR